MEFRNKQTNEIVTANGYAETFAFLHNSNYELVVKTNESKKDNLKTKESKIDSEITGNKTTN